MEAKKPSSRRTYVWIGIGIGVAVAIGAAIALTSSNPVPVVPVGEQIESSEVKVFPADSRPYGKTYLEYSIAWWSMIQNIPPSENPVLDTTGEKCQVGQNDPNVFFLHGNFGGATKRTCIIPGGMAIFIPLVASECSSLEDKSLDTEEKRKACAEAGVGGPRGERANFSLSVDENDVSNSQIVRAGGAIRGFELFEDNIWGTEAGVTDEYVDGYYAILEPLSDGEHDISWKGAVTNVDGTQAFALELDYHIIVKKANQPA